MTPKNTICLWFDKDAEEAARFYAATFPDSEVTAVHKAPSDYPGGKEGDVLTVEFTVLGIPCLGLNGGPEFKHSEAFSFQVATDNQEETDRYWNAIVGNGGQESECGWCKDRWGLSWQITPRALTDAMAAGGAEAKRAFEAMMPMKKIDVATIEAARRGWRSRGKNIEYCTRPRIAHRAATELEISDEAVGGVGNQSPDSVTGCSRCCWRAVLEHAGEAAGAARGVRTCRPSDRQATRDAHGARPRSCTAKRARPAQLGRRTTRPPPAPHDWPSSVRGVTSCTRMARQGARPVGERPARRTTRSCSGTARRAAPTLRAAPSPDRAGRHDGLEATRPGRPPRRARQPRRRTSPDRAVPGETAAPPRNAPPRDFRPGPRRGRPRSTRRRAANTRRTIEEGAAPSAMRSPISLCRARTACATTP